MRTLIACTVRQDGTVLLVTVLAGGVSKYYLLSVFGAGAVGTSGNLPQEPTHMVLGHDSDTACQLEELSGVQHLTRAPDQSRCPNLPVGGKQAQGMG